VEVKMAQTLIENSAMFKQVFSEIAKMAIDSVASEVYGKEENKGLLYGNILGYTYGFNLGRIKNEMYWNETQEPTYEFLNSFEWTSTVDTPFGTTKKLYYNSDLMAYDPETYKHGSQKRGDQREVLADLLNVSGMDRDSDFGGRWREPFWNITLSELEKAIPDFFDDILYAQGFTRT
jgi:hypothetical protein